MVEFETGLYELAVERLHCTQNHAARTHALEVGGVNIQVDVVDVAHPVCFKTALENCDCLLLAHIS